MAPHYVILLLSLHPMPQSAVLEYSSVAACYHPDALSSKVSGNMGLSVKNATRVQQCHFVLCAALTTVLGQFERLSRHRIGHVCPVLANAGYDCPRHDQSCVCKLSRTVQHSTIAQATYNTSWHCWTRDFAYGPRACPGRPTVWKGNPRAIRNRAQGLWEHSRSTTRSDRELKVSLADYTPMTTCVATMTSRCCNSI